MTNSIFKKIRPLNGASTNLKIASRDSLSARDFELIQNSSILISVIRNLAVKNPHFFRGKIVRE